MLTCRKSTFYILIFFIVFAAQAASTAVSCSPHRCQLLDPCSKAEDCGSGLYCGNCPSAGKNQPTCTRAQTIQPTSVVEGLAFNKYSWLVTHNSFSNLNEPSHTGTQRLTFYNQEDSVTNQLLNGVRGFMLDMYDFEDDIWLCHSLQGHCYNFTAFEPAINTLKEVGAFLAGNPSEIVTIFIEDYVHSFKGLTKLFTDAGLFKYWFPVSEMPSGSGDWPTVTTMVAKNHRLLVFTSIASKEADEGIAYQWRYIVENESGDPGIVQGSCPNRKESQPLNSRTASSLFLQNYFPTIPIQNEACKEHSSGLVEMVGTCYKAAGRLPNFVAVNFYMRSNGGGVFDVQDKINGRTLCGCDTVTACQPGKSRGDCKNVRAFNQTSPSSDLGGKGGIYSGYIEFNQKTSNALRLWFAYFLILNLFCPILMLILILL
ncbi:PLC-like phosphodiesterases superfamily protein [Zostera marina]|uniref:PLC-like phosphodiesterases superfamily protein n=1 Tax=Zostera marina TaxID=29655 RepID=A0A0K9NYB2_ZOSMR|nr:PLC-like phosphodiesterases superfamily protein [Zostera marina]